MRSGDRIAGALRSRGDAPGRHAWISRARRLLRTRVRSRAARGISSRRSSNADPALGDTALAALARSRGSRRRTFELEHRRRSAVCFCRRHARPRVPPKRGLPAAGCDRQAQLSCILAGLPRRQSSDARRPSPARGSEPVPGRRAGGFAGRSCEGARRSRTGDAARRLEPDGRREIRGGPDARLSNSFPAVRRVARPRSTSTSPVRSELRVDADVPGCRVGCRAGTSACGTDWRRSLDCHGRDAIPPIWWLSHSMAGCSREPRLPRSRPMRRRVQRGCRRGVIRRWPRLWLRWRRDAVRAGVKKSRTRISVSSNWVRSTNVCSISIRASCPMPACAWRAALESRVHSRRRKESGTFYTPQPLAEFVVRRTLSPLVLNATTDDILALRIVDPAMGSGAFLVAACRFLADAYERALVDEGRCAESDLDPDARAGIRRLVAEQVPCGRRRQSRCRATGALVALARDARQGQAAQLLRPSASMRRLADRCVTRRPLAFVADGSPPPGIDSSVRSRRPGGCDPIGRASVAAASQRAGRHGR